jgi:hypothetical protein
MTSFGSLREYFHSLSSSARLIVQLLLLPEQHEVVTAEKRAAMEGRPQNYSSFPTSSMSQTDGRFGPPVTVSSSVIT